ncbi:MAG TPA: hypothetical protein VE153_35975 [Myxococcus sp.]|jgi:hypothetical protein|nr:hypothetical protein [Myxococcus sp.]
MRSCPLPPLLSVLFLATSLLASGCGPRGEGAAPARGTTHIWTVREVREHAATGRELTGWNPGDWMTLRGRPLPLWSPPYHRFEQLQPSGHDALNVLPAFSEGRAAAYSVLEVWQGVPEVWVQPWYVLVTAHEPSRPGAHRLPGALPLVDIGEDSLFYSPFWEVIYVVVPEDTPPDRYTRVMDLFGAGLPMYRGGGLLAPLAPPDVRPAAPEDGKAPQRPLSGDAVASPGMGEVWLRGERVTYLDFGGGAFTWNTAPERSGVVDEVALYVFALPDARGRLAPLGLPSVIGTGPRGSARPARLSPAGAPRFGALTRPHLVALPRGAGPFIPSSMKALKESLRERGVTVVDVHPTVEHLAGAKDYLLRVALNPECFEDLVGFPVSCQWLDSQAAVEAGVPAVDVRPGDVLFTSPIVYFGGPRLEG